MSSRPCNYCSVKRLREEAEKTGATVHLVPPLVDADIKLGFPESQDVFLVPAGEALNTEIDSSGNHGPQWKMWVAALPDRCAC